MRLFFVISSDSKRREVIDLLKRVPWNSRVEVKDPKRTLPQNAAMWGYLTTLSRAVPYHGIQLQPEDFKLIFLSALKREARIVPNLDGTGFVNLSASSSDLSKEEMSDMLELIHAFAAQHGVELHDPEPATLKRQVEAA